MRLVVVAHGPTSGLRAMRFGDQSGLEHPELVQPVQRRVRSWYSGPEPACVETARLLGGEPIVVDTLAAPAAGDWAGRTLSEVLDSDPDRVRRWMTDPDGAPPGGESWTGAVQRIGLTVDQLATVVSAGAAGPNPTGVVVLVVSPWRSGLSPRMRSDWVRRWCSRSTWSRWRSSPSPGRRPAGGCGSVVEPAPGGSQPLDRCRLRRGVRPVPRRRTRRPRRSR